MDAAITRHFATLGRRQVHYRRAGAGAPVLLLHPSPESSAGFGALIRRLSVRFTVIAPDTPGNGLSDPLDETWPDMAAFADNVVQLMDALAIPRAAIYGYHTGALCGLELARRHPGRVALCVANGYLQMPEAVQRDIVEHYFVPLAPIDWSGSHLTWLWSRMREQWNFFPWYRPSLATRGLSEPPDAAGLHQAVMNMLQAGNGYRGAYRAAFTCDAPGAVQEIRAPTLITCPRDDILFPSLAAMPKPADGVRVVPADTLAGCEDLLERTLVEDLPDLPTPGFAPTEPIDGGIWSDMIRVRGLSLHARRSTSGEGRPVVFVHDLAGSSRCWDETLEEFAGRRPVVAVDLPGRGESDPWPAERAPAIADQAAFLAEALDALSYHEFDLVADKMGAPVALALAAHQPERARHLLLLEVPQPGDLERLGPSLIPDLAGGHLAAAWHAARDMALFAPWHDRRARAAIRWREPDLEPARIHRRVLALLASAPLLPALDDALAAFDLEKTLAALATPLLLGCPGSPATPHGMAGPERLQVGDLSPRDPARFAREALAFFETPPGNRPPRNRPTGSRRHG